MAWRGRQEKELFTGGMQRLLKVSLTECPHDLKSKRLNPAQPHFSLPNQNPISSNGILHHPPYICPSWQLPSLILPAPPIKPLWAELSPSLYSMAAASFTALHAFEHGTALLHRGVKEDWGDMKLESYS